MKGISYQSQAVSFNLILGKAIEKSSEEIDKADSSIITTQQNHSAPKPIVKIARAKPKSLQGIPDIQQILGTCIDFGEIETWALGSVFKTVHQGANKYLSILFENIKLSSRTWNGT